jgi:hypothetical protein
VCKQVSLSRSYLNHLVQINLNVVKLWLTDVSCNLHRWESLLCVLEVPGTCTMWLSAAPLTSHLYMFMNLLGSLLRVENAVSEPELPACWTYPFRWCVGCDSMAMFSSEVIKRIERCAWRRMGEWSCTQSRQWAGVGGQFLSWPLCPRCPLNRRLGGP